MLLLLAAAVAAASPAAATPTGVPPSSVSWAWAFLGGNLSSTSADAQNDGSVTNINEATGWAAPSDVYSLLTASDDAITTFHRIEDAARTGAVETCGAGAGWTLINSVNESGPAAAVAATRGVVGVRGAAAVVPPVVWGGLSAADTDGALGCRLWLYGGVVAVTPI